MADLASLTVSHEELDLTHSLVTNCVAFYDLKKSRKQKLQDLRTLIHDGVLDSITMDLGRKTFTPDGVTMVPCEKLLHRIKALSAFFELRNGMGEGDSDPIHQGESDFALFYSAELVRLSTCHLYDLETDRNAASIFSRFLLLSHIHYWPFGSVFDDLRRCFRRPPRLSAPYRLYLSWALSASR
jgi:hypothetical protein